MRRVHRCYSIANAAEAGTSIVRLIGPRRPRRAPPVRPSVVYLTMVAPPSLAIERRGMKLGNVRDAFMSGAIQIISVAITSILISFRIRVLIKVYSRSKLKLAIRNVVELSRTVSTTS